MDPDNILGGAPYSQDFFMSATVNSPEKPGSLQPEKPNPLRQLADLAQMPIQDNADRFAFRMIMYLLEGILIGLGTYLWLEHAQLGKLYHWLFPIIVAFLIAFFHFAFVEFIYKFLRPPQRKLGHTWAISLVGLVFGFLLAYSTGICGIVCRILNSYCPVKWHTSPPETILVFFRTVWFPWLIATFFMTQGLLKKHIAGELASIKQINHTLEQKRFEFKSADAPFQEEAYPPSNWGDAGSDTFRITLKESVKDIPIADIYYIAVEDHYCKIVFNRKGETFSEYVRLSLKNALAKLPESLFTQVHRSFIVNLLHVKEIKKVGQTYQLFVEGLDGFLPASRHRAAVFLPKLKAILNPNIAKDGGLQSQGV